MDFKQNIRSIADFPKPGIDFKDITTLLQNGQAFRGAVDTIVNQFKDERIDLVVGPEARGFVIGAPVAYALQAGFVPVRKPGKLPAEVLEHTYDLEYGQDKLAVHKDAIKPGQRVLIVDDLLATGGTIQAVKSMVQELGGQIAGFAFLIELTFLNGREKLPNDPIFSVVQY